jgi:hypothetical protein
MSIALNGWTFVASTAHAAARLKASGMEIIGTALAPGKRLSF